MIATGSFAFKVSGRLCIVVPFFGDEQDHPSNEDIGWRSFAIITPSMVSRDCC